MEREFLEKQGLNEDQVKAVMTQYGKDVNGVKSDYESKIAGLNDQIDGFKQNISDRDAKIKELGGQVKDNQDLEEKFKEAQKTIADNDAKTKAQLLDQKKNFAVQQALTKAGAYNNKAVMALIDMDRVSTDDKGNILHVDDVVSDAQKAFPQGFKPQEKEEEKPKPAVHAVPSGNGTSELPKDPSKMSLEDQNKLYRQDKSAWRKLFEK